MDSYQYKNIYLSDKLIAFVIYEVTNESRFQV